MQNDIQLSADILKQIEAIVKKMNFSAKDIKIFLFGSRVNQNAAPRSDIDIGLKSITQKKIPVTLKFDFEDELEKIPTLLTFDVVDYSYVSKNFEKLSTENIYYLN